jgi:hypothetical protein
VPNDRAGIRSRISDLQDRLLRGLQLIESNGFQRAPLKRSLPLESPNYSKLLQMVSLGDEVGVALATQRFTYTVHMSDAAVARRRAYDLALSMLIDSAIHQVQPATIVLDRGTGAGVRSGGVHLSIDRWQGGEVIATIVTDFADVVAREKMNSSLLSLASWWTIPTAAPHKPLFRKTWPNPDTAGPGTGDSSAIAAAISLAVIHMLDAVGEGPVLLLNTLKRDSFGALLTEQLFPHLRDGDDLSVARDIVRIPRSLWKVPHQADVDPRVETEEVQSEVARALQLANDADDMVSIMALDDVALHLTERRIYESELIDWLRIMAEQRAALIALSATIADQKEENR